MNRRRERSDGSGISAASPAAKRGFESIVLDGHVDSAFPYYAALAAGRDLDRHGAVRAFAEVSQGSLESISVPEPPELVRKRIAEALLTLVRKLDLLDRRRAGRGDTSAGECGTLLTGEPEVPFDNAQGMRGVHA